MTLATIGFHELTVEKILEPDGGPYPRCIKGKRACPPEDCGGPWGYEEYVEAMADPAHPQHQEMVEWRGKDFNPEHFDLKAADHALEDLR